MPDAPRFDTLLIQQAEGVSTLTLNRPESYNALNDRLKIELLEALKWSARDVATRCVVITGAGKAFCSGQDLKEIEPAQTSVGDTIRQRYNPIVKLITGMEKPVIAAVNGVAAGAGCSLALACDLRVVAESASFRLAFSSIGLVPDSGACFLLPRLVGLGVALELAYSGRAVDAHEALRLGVANQVVPVAELAEATTTLARSLAQRPTRALGLTKRAMLRSLSLDLEGSLEYEAQMQEIAGATADFTEGVRAFREKRAAIFEGR